MINCTTPCVILYGKRNKNENKTVRQLIIAYCSISNFSSFIIFIISEYRFIVFTLFICLLFSEKKDLRMENDGQGKMRLWSLVDPSQKVKVLERPDALLPVGRSLALYPVFARALVV